MKKLILITIVLFLSATFCYAQIRGDIVRTTGTITSIDNNKNQITILDLSSGAEKTFSPKKGIDASLSIGDQIRITHKLNSSVANVVKLINKGSSIQPVRSTNRTSTQARPTYQQKTTSQEQKGGWR